MFKGYGIIITLFILGGLGTAVWGWTFIAKARKRRAWPKVQGVIESAERTSQHDDLLPDIVFSYSVGDKNYRRTIEFPSGDISSPEFVTVYLKRYPVGKQVQVYYDPTQPEDATLEPGTGGDWLIFVIGLGAAIFGGVLLLARA